MTQENKKAPSVRVTITARVYRNYGPEAVEFGISRDVEITNAETRHLEYAKLMTVLHDEHTRYSGEFLPNVPAPTVHAPGVENAGGRWVVAEEIVVEIKDKKRYYYVRGGEFSKHGVACYPEVLRTIGVEDVMKENDSLKLSNKEMLVVSGTAGMKVAQFRSSAPPSE